MKHKSKKKSNKTKNKNNEEESLVEELDPNSEEFLYDDVDMFHRNQEKILISKGVSFSKNSEKVEEEEVLGVASDSDDDDERIAEYESRLKQMRGSLYEPVRSDDEDEQEEKEAEEEEDDLEGVEEMDDDQLEEREALQIQKKLIGQFDEDDFGLGLVVKGKAEEEEENLEKIRKNLKNLSQKEKLKLLQAESPELEGLIYELKTKLNTIIFKFNSSNRHEMSSYEKYETKLIMDYITNLSFYLLLKFKRKDVFSHPVLERIYFFNEALKKLEKPEDKKEMSLKKKMEEEKSFEEEEEMNNEDEEEDEDEKRRAINKTIEKNRGLTPHRKKENKNPRVKHRNKFRKALIRRKGQVRPVRKELDQYQGEISGIKPGIKRSIRLK